VFRVVFSPESRAELEELKSYIAARESRRVAAKYLKRLIRPQIFTNENAS
jgi:plasmid stabilization system protein ParE